MSRVSQYVHYEVDENETAVIMDCNSLVDMPAHMKPMIHFNKQAPQYHIFKEEERKVMGVMISAGTPIYRNDENGEYYGIFRKEVITKIKDRFMKQNHMHNLNTQHDSSKMVNGAYLTDVWQVDFAKGIQVPDSLEDQNIQDGSLIGIYKITDNAVWMDVKARKYRGFSIEAYLNIKKVNIKKVNMNKQTTPVKTLMERLGWKKPEPATFAQATAEDGTVLMYDGELAIDTALFVEVGGEQVPATGGEWTVTLEDGSMKIVTVDDNGIVSAVADAMNQTEEMAEVVEEVLTQVAEAMEAQNAVIETLKAQNVEFAAQNKVLLSRVEKLEGKKPEPPADKGKKFAPTPKPKTDDTAKLSLQELLNKKKA